MIWPETVTDFGQPTVQSQQSIRQFPGFGVNHPIRHMSESPAICVDHPPAKVPKTRINAQYPHGCLHLLLFRHE
jgi:hypothetical protein